MIKQIAVCISNERPKPECTLVEIKNASKVLRQIARCISDFVAGQEKSPVVTSDVANL